MSRSGRPPSFRKERRALRIFEPGDAVHFPELAKPHGREMYIAGGRMTRHVSGKRFINYLIKGHAIPPKVVCSNCGTKYETDQKNLEYSICPQCGVKRVFEFKDRCGMTDRLAQYILDSIEDHYDCIIKVAGDVGVGKSNWAIDFAQTVDPTFIDDLDNRYVYDMDKFINYLYEHWEEIRPGMCFLMDEATNLVNKRNWQSDVSKSFDDFQKMFRSLGLIMIMIMPVADDFDKGLRETARARYTVTVLDLPNGGKYEGRGFYELEMKTKGDGGKHVKTVHVGLGTFPKMAAETDADYDQLKRDSQKKKLAELRDRLNGTSPEKEGKGRDKEMALWFMLHEGWETKEVSKQFNIPEGTLRRWKKEYRDGQ